MIFIYAYKIEDYVTEKKLRKIFSAEKNKNYIKNQ